MIENTILVNGIKIEKSTINSLLIQDKKVAALKYICDTADVDINVAKNILVFFQKGTIHDYDGQDVLELPNIKKPIKKKSKLKPFLIIGSIILFLVMAAYGIFFYLEYQRQYQEENEPYLGEGMVSDAYDGRQNLFFGDDTKLFYLLKGKLLNNNAKTTYDKLPDTLYKINFKDEIYKIRSKNNTDDIRYSIFDTLTVDQINNKYATNKQANLVEYLKLASKKEVEYPKVSGENFESYLILKEIYQEYRTDYFENKITHNIPFHAKYKLLEFFESEEGQNYEFVTSGNQKSSQLIWYGSLTNDDKKEVAILLRNITNELENHYKLLVYAEKENYQFKPKEYYLLYNEDFYTKAILDYLPSREYQGEMKKIIYKDTEELVPIEANAFIIKRLDMADYAYMYDHQFDGLISFVQLPKSILDKQEDYEGEDF